MPDYSRMEKPVENPRAPHVAVTLVLDVSYSMTDIVAGGKSSIALLNEGVNEMISELSNDQRLSEIVDLSIITFGDPGKAEVYQDFAPVGQVSPVNLVADHGSTYAADAINKAVDNTRERMKQYRGGWWKPWVVVITDGEFHDDVSQVATKVRQREGEGKLRTYCLGVGRFNPSKMKEISDRSYALESYKLKEFLDWIGRSLAVVSTSAVGTEVQLPSNEDPNSPGTAVFVPYVEVH